MKKFVSLLTAAAMCAVMSVPALAVDDLAAADEEKAEVTVVNLSDEISEDVLQEIVDSTSACLVAMDGTSTPVDSVVTVEDVTDEEAAGIARLSDSDEVPGKAYKVTLSATASANKTVTDSGSQNGSGYNGSATLELVWVDGPGLDNVIKKVSGSVTVYNNTVVEDAYVQWGNGWQSAITWTKKDLKSKFSNMSNGVAVRYSEEPNETVPCPKAASSTLFKGSWVYLSLSVSSGVTQGS